MLDTLKVALVCDWLTVTAGAERVLLNLHELFPNAPIYTSLYSKSGCPAFAKADVRESGLAWIPGARRFHRLFLPWMPQAFEKMDFSEFDLVISSSHAACKGIITQPHTLHVSYCHSPMRYVWDHSHEYQRKYKNFSALRFLYQPVLHRIRQWDYLAAQRVDHFIANSHFVAARIAKYYERDSEVLHPPVDLHRFHCRAEKDDHFLLVGRLIPYKHFDLALLACQELGLKVRVVGTGPEWGRLKQRFGDSAEFLGAISDADLALEYGRARALIFPQLEDFGIVPLEAMASGTPVIALAQGGALETVSDGVSGLFFDVPTVESVKEAIQRFLSRDWPAETVAETVASFSPAHFKSSLRHLLEKAWTKHRSMIG